MMKEKLYVNSSYGFLYILLYCEFYMLFIIVSESIDNVCEI